MFEYKRLCDLCYIILDMNVYDWDKTIYDGDSSVDFIFYLFRNRPKTLLNAPLDIVCGLLYGLRIMPKQTFKQNVFRMFKYVDDMDKVVDEFTTLNLKKVKDWYKNNQKEDDVVISASPEFLIAAFCKKVGIDNVMGSPVDIYTGEYSGLNCHGKEKVKRFNEVYKDEEIDEFYSDSYSDDPLAKLSKKPYLVKGNELLTWEK